MVLLLRFSPRHNFYTLDPNKTCTIGRGEDVDVRMDYRHIRKIHAEISYDKTAGEWYITCKKYFTPPDTSGLFFEVKPGEWVAQTTEVLRHGSWFYIGNHEHRQYLEVLDFELLCQERDSLKITVRELERDLAYAREDNASLQMELRTEQSRWLGEGSRPEKHRKV
jgi:hypothetical protein